MKLIKGPKHRTMPITRRIEPEQRIFPNNTRETLPISFWLCTIPEPDPFYALSFKFQILMRFSRSNPFLLLSSICVL
ncbi:hypothetical protein QVD17_30828 [Tagetes erecta]|uniref:Uncharacterized protein n=1 Tax=Tagetes erecta TaxID=13708 RepID=A0AAD8K4C8_TARER|nr:hypothetical protein QVD17_30828 [Tagetes erecta]